VIPVQAGPPMQATSLIAHPPVIFACALASFSVFRDGSRLRGRPQVVGPAFPAARVCGGRIALLVSGVWSVFNIRGPVRWNLQVPNA
jgi:hypothetical protein